MGLVDPSPNDFGNCRTGLPATQFSGYDFRFSPDSRTIAVWHDDQISIYGWGINPKRAFELDIVSVDASTQILMPENAEERLFLSGKAVWSQDSRYLAYSDAAGLWLWDVFTQTPELLIARDGGPIPIPVARYFSDSGRYLAVSEGDTHTIHDLHSDVILPDGIINSEERLLLRNDTVGDNLVPAEMCNMMDGTCEPICPDAETEVMSLASNWGYRNFMTSIAPEQNVDLLLCVDGVCGYSSCDAIANPEITIRSVNAYYVDGRHRVSQLGDYELYFNHGYQTFNFMGDIEAPIKEVYWLPMPYDDD